MTNNLKYSFRIYKPSVQVPLYKYYGNLDFAEDAIVNKRIHLECPLEYNDIFDSAFSIDEQSLRSMRNNATNISNIAKMGIPEEYHGIIDKCSAENGSNDYSFDDLLNYIYSNNPSAKKTELAKNLIENMFPSGKIQASNNKISCFSENYASLLMWAYYANNHKGVCLKFNIKDDEILSQYCFKVNYTEHLECVDTSFNSYYRKGLQWSHEQEWRVVCDTVEEYLYTNSLDAIILGCRISDENRLKFTELAKKYHVQLIYAYPSKEKYELEFKKCQVINNEIQF